MYLKELIERLEKADPDKKVKRGFGKPMSYRGYYDEVAFRPEENVTVGEMLKHARSALGATFEGYKGGEYTMTEYTEVHIAEYGSSDDLVWDIALSAMLGEA